MKNLSYFLALCSGILAGYVDWRNDEPQSAAILILIFSLIFGYFYPKKAWLFALIIAFSLPLVHFTGAALGLQTPFGPPQPSIWTGFIAAIPALIGGYSGVFIKKFFIGRNAYK